MSKVYAGTEELRVFLIKQLFKWKQVNLKFKLDLHVWSGSKQDSRKKIIELGLGNS